jgi:hypothetical protein
VVADAADRDMMSIALGVAPVFADSSCASRANRPNLQLEECGTVGARRSLWSSSRTQAGSGLQSVGCLPTFARVIPWRRPPLEPAGLASCDKHSLERGRAERLRYPPYTYQAQCLFAGPSEPRVATPTERLRLVGFRTNRLDAMLGKEERSRFPARWDSFGAGVVAVLLRWALEQTVRGFQVPSAKQLLSRAICEREADIRGLEVETVDEESEAR